MGMLKRLFGDRRGKTPSVPSVPEGERVYAIGDIHGRVDLLSDMHRMIMADAEAAPDSRLSIVYLGDYIDRGLHSREVIDLLIDDPLPGFVSAHLLGNHEEFLIDFAESLSSARMWLYNGGDATLRSYGVEVPEIVRDDRDLAEARDTLFRAMPVRHLEFLRSLRLCHEVGDYFFVHAGVRPGVALHRQKPEDLTWIREDFLSSTADFGRVVVHGHSVSRDVEMLANRIGIDTGAYASGMLSCLVLQGTDRWILQT